jgi:hypothetical protein
MMVARLVLCRLEADVLIRVTLATAHLELTMTRERKVVSAGADLVMTAYLVLVICRICSVAKQQIREVILGVGQTNIMMWNLVANLCLVQAVV